VVACLVGSEGAALRGHLGWVVLLTMVTVTAVLIIRAVAHGTAAHEVARATAAVPARMAASGYRPARWGNDYWVKLGFPVGQYAYCQPGHRCDTPAGNLSHPPVDVLSDGLIVTAYIWWSSGPRSACLTSSPALSGSRSISSRGWSASLSRLARQVRYKVAAALREDADLATDVESAPGFIKVNGWRCSIP
jgi:hypothetical protein